MNLPRPSTRPAVVRPGRLAALLALTALAACSGGDDPLAPGPTAPSQPLLPQSAIAVLSCSASVRERTLTCGGDGGSTSGARTDRVIGGQNVNVRLTSSNLAYDSVAEVFRADITVQNLGVQRLGTADGTTVPGVKVFFHVGPTVTAGQGIVSVANPDGYGDFTGSQQPYFSYPEVLPLNAVSAVRTWRWSVPRSATSFVFKVYVSAPVLPVVIFDHVEGGNRDIWRVALDGSDMVRLTTHGGDDQNPTYARGKVVFTSFRDGNAELYSVPVTGGTETRLTTTTANEIEPALSPDGTRLAYTNDVSGVNKLWLANGDGTGGARLSPVSFGFGGSIEAAPSWAPSGDRVAFVATNNGSSDIFDFTIPGTPTLIVGSDSTDIEPAWSPDGTRLAFASRREGDTELYMMTVATRQVTRLTFRAGTDSQPAWLSDGRLAFVAFTSGTPRLRWLDPANPAAVFDIPMPAGPAQRPTGVLF